MRSRRPCRPRVPPHQRDSKISELFDQSVFVTSSIEGVLREGAIAAALTALMILLFLGSWRSTLVVMISIPLAILSSLVLLYFLGETLNTMTLGGLALVVGILVDDSTVTIENTHRLLTEERMSLPQATLHGAASIAVPTLVSTLAIACVFTSIVFLHGPAKYLFTPLGFAVVFAMLASYGLLADADAGHDRPASQGGAARRGGRDAAKLVAPLSRRLHARFRAHARRLCCSADAFASSTRDRSRGSGLVDRARCHHAGICRPRLLSRHRWRADPATRPRTRGNADRSHRTSSSRRSRTRYAKSSPRASVNLSSTILGCRREPTILPFPTARPLGSTTASFSWR